MPTMQDFASHIMCPQWLQLYLVYALSMATRAAHIIGIIPDHQTDTSAVTDTWLKEMTISAILTTLEQLTYSVIRVPLPDGRRGGGIVLIHR